MAPDKRRRLWAAILLVLACAGVFVGYDIYQARSSYREVYGRYYDYYYQAYLPRMGEMKAQHYASYYAGYFADYYTSDAYEEMLEGFFDFEMGWIGEGTNGSKHLSFEGYQWLKAFEGVRLTPYFDAGGKMTVGYGHLMRRGELHGSLTMAQAEELLKQDVAIAEGVVQHYVTVPLRQSQFDALVMLVFNIGAGQFAESRLLRYVNAGDHQRAAKEFLRWQHVDGEKVPGLQRRRSIERALYLS
jgi:lysozyme